MPEHVPALKFNNSAAFKLVYGIIIVKMSSEQKLSYSEESEEKHVLKKSSFY